MIDYSQWGEEKKIIKQGVKQNICIYPVSFALATMHIEFIEICMTVKKQKINWCGTDLENKKGEVL